MSKLKKRKNIKTLSEKDFKNIHNPMRDIKDILVQLEIDHNIEILYCSIIGSRAYGLVRNDSDYNVRFIYKKPLNYYLTLEPTNTQITYNEFEYNFVGWDISKALKLHYKSNVTLYEWLNTPLKIIDDDEIKFNAITKFDKNKLLYAYTHLAKKNFDEGMNDIPHLLTKDQLRHYMYSIRYILSWDILHDGEYPPLSIRELIARNVKIPKDIEEYVGKLITAYINEKKEVVGFVELANINSWIFNKIRMMENTNLLNPPQRTSMIYHDLKFQQIVKKEMS